MDLGLTGHVVAITAAGAGIGLATAAAFAGEGAHVVAADRDVDALRALPSTTALELDLLDPAAAEQLIDAAVEEHGRLDAVVTCLGGPVAPGTPFAARDDGAWAHAFELNLMNMVRTSRAALPHLVARGGSLVHVASDLARQPDPGFADYAAMKAAVLSVSKSLSVEAAPTVRSNVVSPGPTRTPGLVADFEALARARGDHDGEAAIAEYVRDVRRMPAGRLGTPEEVAGAILFLASPAAAQITGAELVVDGGVRKAA